MDRDASIEYAKKYIEDLLSFFDLNIDVVVSADEDVIEVSIPSTHLNGFLIGQRGDTLRSIQFLLSQALKVKEAEIQRVNVDVAEYKKQRNERLAAQVREWCQSVIEKGEPLPLKSMSAVERRVVHHTVSEFSELSSHSEGEGRDRHIIIEKVS